LSDKLKTFALFAVFDGHSGREFADVMARDLVQLLLKRPPFKNLKDGESYDIEEITKCLEQTFIDCDEEHRADKHEIQGSGW
jgi:serine/threonine protein phosphatase PrpC